MNTDSIIVLVLLLAFISPLLFLVSLNVLPRWGRMTGYGLTCAIHFVVAIGWHSLEFIERNNASGMRTLEFFETLQQQLASGTVQQNFLKLPGLFWPTVLSMLSVTAIIVGGVFTWRKIRWYSWFVLMLAFVMIHFSFSADTRAKFRKDIMNHNKRLYNVYEMVARKREQGVTDKQMAEAIEDGLKEFHFTYENRLAEGESVTKLFEALRALEKR